MNSLGPQFHRRWNNDGSIDSICLRCFLTIQPQLGVDLKMSEVSHACVESISEKTLANFKFEIEQHGAHPRQELRKSA